MIRIILCALPFLILASPALAEPVTLTMIGTALLNAAISTVISMALSVIFKPSKPKGLDQKRKLQNRIQSVREAVGAWEVVYGEVRKGGNITFIETTENNNRLHLVITLASHEVEAIDTVFLNEIPIWDSMLDSNGKIIDDLGVTNKYSNNGGLIRVQKHLGAIGVSAVQPFPDLASAVTTWTPTHIQRGRAGIYLRLQYGSQEFASGIPNISAWVKGKKLVDPRNSSTTSWSPNAALALRDYMVLPNVDGGPGATSLEFNDTFTNAAANTSDEIVTNSTVTTSVISINVSGNYLNLAGSTITMFTGDRVHVSSVTGSVVSPLTAGQAYYVSPTQRHSDVRIQLASTLVKAYAGSTIVFGSSGGESTTVMKTGEPRYTMNGVVTLDAKPIDIMSDMLSAIGGKMTYGNGVWRIIAGAWAGSSLTITEDDIISPIDMQTKVGFRDRFNAVKGVFITTINQDQPSDYPVVVNSTYQTEDGGVQRFTEYDLPFTNRSFAAQRLAKIHLEENRQDITLKFTMNLKGLQVQAGDVVSVVHDRFGWSTAAAKAFEVTDWGLTIPDSENPYMAVELNLRETASGIFDWNSGDETITDLAANSSLANPFSVVAPTLLVAVSGDDQLLTNVDGTLMSRVKLTWVDSVTSHATRHRVQYKKSTDANFTEAGTPYSGDQQIYLSDVEDGTNYDFRVRGETRIGIYSDYLTLSNHTVLGKSAPPSAPTSFTVSEAPDGTRNYEYGNTSEAADVRSGGGYRIRYFLGSTSDWDAMTALHDGLIISSPHESNLLAAGTYTFAIKTVDSSNIESLTALFANSVIIGDPRLAGALLHRTEFSLVWPGSTTSAYVDSGPAWVRATGNDWSSMAGGTWGALSTKTWGDITTRDSPIAYVTPTIDITGKALNIPFTPLVTVVASGAQTITMETGTHAQGSPTGGFVTPALATGRYVRLRVEVSSVSSHIEEMVTVIDAASKSERFEDVSTANATAETFERIGNGHFLVGTKGGISVITQAQIVAIQNSGPGYSWELTDKASTLSDGSTVAAGFQIYNASNVSTDAVVDVLLRGVKA